MIYSYNTIVHAWPVLVLAIVILTICYYFTRENKETYYSPRAMDQYFDQIKNSIWREGEKRLHKLRNQDHAQILKTNNELKKHKQAYMYSREFLIKDLAQNMGLYGHVPDYVRTYRESENLGKISDKDVMRKMYKFVLSDTETRIYYVYYDLESHSYKWLDIISAASKSNVPMSTSARNIIEACSMLSLHFNMGEKARLDWHKLNKADYLGYVFNENGESIKLKMHMPSAMQTGVVESVQLYKTTKDAEFASYDTDLMPVSELFDLALKRCTALRKRELERIKKLNQMPGQSYVPKRTDKTKTKIIDLPEERKG